MEKYLRSEYVFGFFLLLVLGGLTALFLKLAPDQAAVIIGGFYTGFVSQVIALFKSKYEKDKAVLKNKEVANG